MRYVYSNAVITIAAERTGKEIAGRGILLPRDLRGSRPFPLHQLENYIGEQLEPLFQSPQNPEDKHLYIFPDAGEEQHGIRPKGVLDTRGWILQEQLLSPRILYYGQQQLYWDCISQSASEVSPMAASLLNDSNSGETWAFRQIRQTIAGKGNPEMLARLIADVWIYIVRNYSARSLTKPSDKLIAIQGVITALENVLNLSSVAGMWEQDLWKQLTWWTETPANVANHILQSLQPLRPLRFRHQHGPGSAWMAQSVITIPCACTKILFNWTTSPRFLICDAQSQMSLQNPPALALFST